MQHAAIRRLRVRLAALLLGLFCVPALAAPSTAAEIDARVDAALKRLQTDVRGAGEVLARAKGVLVFAEVVKAGLVFAGEGGEGALRVGGRTRGYYSIFSGSVGLQAGAQKRDIIFVFLDDRDLNELIDSKGWRVGVDGSVTLIDTGGTGVIDTATLQKPTVAFVVGHKGLMAGISLDGTKITRIER
jgi:lipid-binding SYLF domain-containing protein